MDESERKGKDYSYPIDEIGSVATGQLDEQAMGVSSEDSTSAWGSVGLLSPLQRFLFAADQLMMERQKEPVHFRVYLAVTIFGISGGFPLRALWLELPVLEKYLPERERLGTLILVLLQCCSVIAVVYLIVRCCLSKKLSEVPVIYSAITVGAISLIVLGCFWRNTVQVQGSPHSFTVLISTLLAGLVANITAVTYVPFIARLKPVYMTAVLLGDILSFVIPHILVTAQGAGDSPLCDGKYLDGNATKMEADLFSNHNQLRSSPAPKYLPFEPRYTVGLYFLVGSIVMVLSAVGFILLRWTRKCQLEYREQEEVVDINSSFCELQTRGPHVDEEDVWRTRSDCAGALMLDDGSLRQSQLYDEHNCATSSDTPSKNLKGKNKSRYSRSETSLNKVSEMNHVPSRSSSGNVHQQQRPQTQIAEHLQLSFNTNSSSSSFAKPSSFKLLLAITFWTSLVINGPLSSVSSYSCYPQGNFAFMVGTLLTDGAMVLACFVAARTRRHKSPVAIIIALTSLGTILLTYFVALITFSKQTHTHNSPLFGNAGEILTMVAWVAVVGLFTYILVSIGVMCGTAGCEAAYWYSGCVSIATFIGRLFTFDDIMICRIFRTMDPCQLDPS